MKMSDIKKKSVSYAGQRIRRYLDNLPFDEYMQYTQLSREGHFGGGTIMLAQKELMRDGYCYEVHGARRQVFYANKKSIAALKALPQP